MTVTQAATLSMLEFCTGSHLHVALHVFETSAGIGMNAHLVLYEACKWKQRKLRNRIDL